MAGTYFYEKLQHRGYDSNQRDLRRRAYQWDENNWVWKQIKLTEMQSHVRTFNSDAFAGPLFFKRGEAFPLTNADHVLFEVKLFSVKA